jgi:hypothetical protein
LVYIDVEDGHLLSIDGLTEGRVHTIETALKGPEEAGFKMFVSYDKTTTTTGGTLFRAMYCCIADTDTIFKRNVKRLIFACSGPSGSPLRDMMRRLSEPPQTIPYRRHPTQQENDM